MKMALQASPAGNVNESLSDSSQGKDGAASQTSHDQLKSMTFGANLDDQNSQLQKELSAQEMENQKGNFADVVVSRTLKYHILLTHRYLFE